MIELKPLIQTLQSHIENECEIEFDGVWWILYASTGKVLASGETLYQLILNIDDVNQ